jgi:hypothetical protein
MRTITIVARLTLYSSTKKTSSRHRRRTTTMLETAEMKVGMKVPDFELTCYDPKAHDFTTAKLADIRGEQKWTILFFYPADFTFV